MNLPLNNIHLYLSQIRVSRVFLWHSWKNYFPWLCKWCLISRLACSFISICWTLIFMDFVSTSLTRYRSVNHNGRILFVRFCPRSTVSHNLNFILSTKTVAYESDFICQVQIRGRSWIREYRENIDRRQALLWHFIRLIEGGWFFFTKTNMKERKINCKLEQKWGIPLALPIIFLPN